MYLVIRIKTTLLRDKLTLILKYIIPTLYLLTFSSCDSNTSQYTYDSSSLKVEQLSNSTFRHISYLSTEKYGRVGCNGMFVINNGEALIVDTPTTDSISKELIEWIENSLKCKTIGIVVTHFHIDCLGGPKEFHYLLNRNDHLVKQ